MRCDLVLGGGGVRGIALVGAVAALERAGYKPYRVAGASAGAMAGALLAAGAGADEMRTMAHELDYRAFALADVMARFRGRAVASLMQRAGMPVDAPAPDAFINETLAARGVETFADLRTDAPDTAPAMAKWRLVVRCLDVANRRVVRLPWDYPLYGLDPDEQSVAKAVRASMSVPIVYDPIRIGVREGGTEGVLVDGGLVSNFAVDVWDRTGGRIPRWPTFGVRLLPRPPSTDDEPIDGNADMLRALVETLLESADAMQAVDGCDRARTISVDTLGVRALDVRLDDRMNGRLWTSGFDAASMFLEDWDWDAYVENCRSHDEH